MQCKCQQGKCLNVPPDLTTKQTLKSCSNIQCHNTNQKHLTPNVCRRIHYLYRSIPPIPFRLSCVVYYDLSDVVCSYTTAKCEVKLFLCSIPLYLRAMVIYLLTFAVGVKMHSQSFGKVVYCQKQYWIKQSGHVWL